MLAIVPRFQSLNLTASSVKDFVYGYPTKLPSYLNCVNRFIEVVDS
jgi:hypothetical protein